MDGEEARGGERGMHGRAKWLEDMELGRGNLGVGEREGGPQSSVGKSK